MKLMGGILLVFLVAGCLPGMKNNIQTEVKPEIGKVVMPPATQPSPTSQPATKIEAPTQAVGIGANLSNHKEYGSSTTSGDHSPSVTFVNSQWPMVTLIVVIAGMWMWEKHSHSKTKHKLNLVTPRDWKNLPLKKSMPGLAKTV